VARFWAKVTRTPGCWWWGGAVSHPDGYGRITWTQDGVRRTLSAHRFALLLELGALGHDTFVEHYCNETLCVRVDQRHIRPGTQSANLRYAVSLGRHRGSSPAAVTPAGGTPAPSPSAPPSPAGTTRCASPTPETPTPPPPCSTSPTWSADTPRG